MCLPNKVKILEHIRMLLESAAAVDLGFYSDESFVLKHEAFDEYTISGKYLDGYCLKETKTNPVVIMLQSIDNNNRRRIRLIVDSDNGVVLNVMSYDPTIVFQTETQVFIDEDQWQKDLKDLVHLLYG